MLSVNVFFINSKAITNIFRERERERERASEIADLYVALEFHICMEYVILSPTVVRYFLRFFPLPNLDDSPHLDQSFQNGFISC